MHINVRGAQGSLRFEDVAKQLEALPLELRARAMKKGARGVAGEIKRDLRARTIPRGTRPLPRPMGRWTRYRRTRDTVRAWSGSPRSMKAYVGISGGIYLLEYGTKYMAPRRPVEKTLEVVGPRAPGIYAKHVRRALDALARKMARGLLRSKPVRR